MKKLGDGTSLASKGEQAREATGATKLTVLADRSYFSGPQVLACGGAVHSAVAVRNGSGAI